MWAEVPGGGRARVDPVRVTFEPEGVTVEVAPGSTLLAAARAAGVALDAPCGGTGRCGSCSVRAEGGLTPLSRDEQELLGGADVAAGKRLACRARVSGPVTVTLGAATGETRVVTASSGMGDLIVEPPSERGLRPRSDSHYLLGAVADIGTTTVAVSLIDLENGDELGSAGMLNVQYPWGADVMSRIASAVAEGTAVLQRPVARQVERLMASLLVPLEGAALTDLREVAIVGNTTMMNALLGEDLTPLGQAPYEGAVLGPVSLPARELGMGLLTDAVCHIGPSASAFIGADVVAGVLATRLDEAERPTLYLDLGTNGEIVLSVPGRSLLAASAAAGPALEGAGIGRGMRAEPGAIERVWLEAGDLAIATVGGFPPVGICGSGVLDLLAVMLEAGALAADGRIAGEVAGPLARRVAERDGVRVFVVDEHSGVALSQHDVRQLQLAKGAVRAAIDLVLAEAGLAPDAVAEVFVAGGFGLHVDGAALERIGMVPDGWGERLAFLGNAAKEGARRTLVDSAARRRAEGIARSIRTLSLAEHPQFQSRFLGALDFPS